MVCLKRTELHIINRCTFWILHNHFWRQRRKIKLCLKFQKQKKRIKCLQQKFLKNYKTRTRGSANTSTFIIGYATVNDGREFVRSFKIIVWTGKWNIIKTHWFGNKGKNSVVHFLTLQPEHWFILFSVVRKKLENQVEIIIYFLTVHYFVVIMSTFPYCAYINIFSIHYNWIFKTNYWVIYIDWIGLNILWNLVMCRLADYKELHRSIWHLAEKYTRYKNLLIFISN